MSCERCAQLEAELAAWKAYAEPRMDEITRLRGMGYEPAQALLIDRLLRARGVPVATGELIDLLAASDSPYARDRAGVRSVRVQVARLRNPRREGLPRVAIETLHGVGYRLDPRRAPGLDA